MSWKYTEFVDPNIDVVLGLVSTHLNTLSADEANTAKVASSDQSGGSIGPFDQHGGNSRAIVVWSAEPNLPSPASLGSGWSTYTWTTDHSYYEMYQGLLATLTSGHAPDGRPLSPAGVYWSRIDMSNMAGGMSTLSLFWR